MAYSKMIIISKAIKMAMAGRITQKENRDTVQMKRVVLSRNWPRIQTPSTLTLTEMMGRCRRLGPSRPIAWKDTDGDGYGDNYGYNLTEVFDENLNLTWILRQEWGDAFMNGPTNGQMLMEMIWR